MIHKSHWMQWVLTPRAILWVAQKCKGWPQLQWKNNNNCRPSSIWCPYRHVIHLLNFNLKSKLVENQTSKQTWRCPWALSSRRTPSQSLCRRRREAASSEKISVSQIAWFCSKNETHRIKSIRICMLLRICCQLISKNPTFWNSRLYHFTKRRIHHPICWSKTH